MDFILFGLISNFVTIILTVVFCLIYCLITFNTEDYISIQKKQQDENKNIKYSVLYNIIPFYSVCYCLTFFYHFILDNSVGFLSIHNSFEKTDLIFDFIKGK